jgi:hypothetical protein
MADGGMTGEPMDRDAGSGISEGYSFGGREGTFAGRDHLMGRRPEPAFVQGYTPGVYRGFRETGGLVAG